MSNEIRSTLDEYCDIKLNTNLVNLNVDFLQDWYINKRVNMIKNKRLIHNLDSDVATLNDDIAGEEKEIQDLKQYVFDNNFLKIIYYRIFLLWLDFIMNHVEMCNQKTAMIVSKIQ